MRGKGGKTYDGVMGLPEKMCPPYEFSKTPYPINESSLKHHVLALIHPCHFASNCTYCLMHNDSDVQWRDIVMDIVFPGLFILGTSAGIFKQVVFILKTSLKRSFLNTQVFGKRYTLLREMGHIQHVFSLF